MKTIKIILTSAAIIAAAFIISCKKSSTPATNPATPDTDLSGASDNTLAENTAADIHQMGGEAADVNSGNSLNNYRTSSPAYTLMNQCATVTRADSDSTITIHFNGDLCSDGRVRTGSLTLHFSPSGAHYRTPGFRFTVTSNSYTVDSNMVDIISESVTNTTQLPFDSATQNETWADVSSLVITKPNGNVIEWNGTHTKILLNTASVYNGPNQAISWSNARVGRTGSAGGTRTGGEIFSSVINDTLIRDFGSCRLSLATGLPVNSGGVVPFIKGTFTYTATDKKYPRLVNYGYENVPGVICDLYASVTINGIQYQIQIR